MEKDIIFVLFACDADGVACNGEYSQIGHVGCTVYQILLGLHQVETKIKFLEVLEGHGSIIILRQLEMFIVEFFEFISAQIKRPQVGDRSHGNK